MSAEAVAKLRVLFDADSSALDKAFGDVNKKAQDSVGIFGKVTGALGSIGLAGMGVGVIKDVVGGVAGSFGGLISSAEALGDAGARVGAVWGAEMQGVMEDNAQVANALGMTKTAYLDQVGALGQLAKSLGVADEAGADMAIGLTELAPKLAAYAGVEADVASDALEKALLGKTKGLAALGFAITDADKARAALSLGIRGEAKDWNEAEIAQINYKAAMEKTVAAQEAWAGNSGDVEVSMQRISSAIEDAKVALGEKLLPLIAPLAQAFAEKLPGAIDAVLGAFQPLIDLFLRVGEKVQPVIDAFSERGIVGALREFGSAMDSALGNSSEELFTFFGDIGFAIRDFLDALSSSDADSILGKLADGLRSIGGDDTPAMLVAIAGAFDAIQSALSSIDWAGVIGVGIEFLSNLWAGIQAVIDVTGPLVTWIGSTLLRAFDSLWPVIKTVIDWMIEHKDIVVAVGGVIMALVGGPITALIGILAALGTAWKNNWGDIQGKTQEFISFFSTSVLPIIQSVFAGIQTLLGNLVGWWQENGDKVIAVVMWFLNYLNELFKGLFQVVSGVVQAGLALLRGDWEGFGAALGKVVAGIVNMIVTYFRGTWQAVKAVLSSGAAGIVSWLKGRGDEMGKMTLQGLVDGIKSGAGKVYQALKDLASGMIKGFMDNLKIGSPSKVFEELGMWIDAGLAAGIDKYDAKAIENMSKIVQAITSMASGLPDAMKKLAEASIPDDATIAQMEAQFDRMLGIVEKFVKRLSIRAVILGTGGNSDKAPADVKEWLRSAGIDPGALLNNSDVTNVGRLLDATQKVIGTWSQIVDTINKVADMKPLAAGAFEEVERRSDQLIAAAERLADKYESALIVGLTDMATAVKAAAEILSTGASLDLSKAAEVTAEQMRIAGANLMLAGQWAWAMVTGWLATAGDEKTRKAWIDSLKDFADTVKAATDILKAGDVGDLSELTEVTADQLRILGANILMAGQWAYTMVTDWLKVAPDHATRQKWIEDMRDFADTIGAAVDIAKASVIGELKSAIIINLDAMRDVLVFVRDQLAPAVEEIVKAWGRASEDAKAATEKMQGFAGWIGAAVNIAKASVVGELHANILINGEVMQAILVWMRDTFAPAMQAISDQWSMTVEAAKPVTEKMKAFADWVGAAADIAKAAVVGELHANILVNFDAMKAILVWMRDTFVPAIQGVVDLWGETAESAKPLVEKMKVFASIIGAAASVARAADVGDLAKVTSPADMGARLEVVKANVMAMFKMMGEIAQVIEVEDAKARADLAEAIGRMSKGMGDFGGGIGGLLDLAESKLFGSDVGNAARGPLSHSQRTRGRRADFFATQLADTVKRAVNAVQDALSGITLTVDDAKVEALAKLGDAFGRIADGLTKLAESKMPNAEQLAAIMGALSGAQQGMGGLAGAGGGAGQGGPMTLNLSNPSLVFSTPITASVQVTTNPVIQIGTRTIETLATIIEQKLSDRFILGAGSGSPITTGNAGDNHGRGQGKGNNDVNPNRRGWG